MSNILNILYSKENSNQVNTKEYKNRYSFLYNIMFVLGVSIIFSGYYFLKYNLENTYGYSTKLITELFVGILLTGIGIFLYIKKPLKVLGSIIIAWSSLFVHSGIFSMLEITGLVSFRNPSESIDLLIIFILIYTILSMIYLILMLLVKNDIFSFLSIIFGTMAFHYFISYILKISEFSSESTRLEFIEIVLYQSIVFTGIVYLIIYYSTKNSLGNVLRNLLNFLGSFIIVFNTLVHRNVQAIETDNTVLTNINHYDFYMFIIIMAFMFIGYKKKNYTMLVIAVLGTIIELFSLTWDYFIDSNFGWPIFLMLFGLITIISPYLLIKLVSKTKNRN